VHYIEEVIPDESIGITALGDRAHGSSIEGGQARHLGKRKSQFAGKKKRDLLVRDQGRRP